MPKRNGAAKRDEEREDRIHNEIIVDANGSDEQVMGWYYYLQDSISPFTATCTVKRATSPLKPGDEVEVTGVGELDDCQREMLVTVRWARKSDSAVPLAQLEPTGDVDDVTREAVEDWLYWVRMGYEF
jgi:hypothetical protein